jgi:hypothetical protein
MKFDAAALQVTCGSRARLTSSAPKPGSCGTSRVRPSRSVPRADRLLTLGTSRVYGLQHSSEKTRSTEAKYGTAILHCSISIEAR